MKNIIIQAGGKGTRLDHHTYNKPKCLVEYGGKTFLQRQLELYSDANIYIVGDYKLEVLKAYVSTFLSEYNISIIDGTNNKGTLSGIKKALEEIKDDEPLAIVWSDLVFEERLRHIESDIQVYTTDSFPCRYLLDDNNNVIKETTEEDGIIGAFTFKNKQVLSNIPDSGSIVGSWLKQQTDNLDIVKTNISNVKELGILQRLEEEFKGITCRFFNSIKIENGFVEKSCIDKEYSHVLNNEKEWYKVVAASGFKHIPEIKSYDPFTMEYITGTHAHKSKGKWNKEEKREILQNICNALHTLHDIGSTDSVKSDIKDMYESKTIERVKQVENLIPFIEQDEIYINNKLCQNPFSKNNLNNFLEKIRELDTDQYNIIHGDLTFNNFLITEDKNVVFYDPRGSFSTTKVYGDKDYDWAKLFYSLVGNYDSVNDKKFKIRYDEKIYYEMESSEWEFLEDDFFQLSGTEKEKILLIHCLIWFSLCGYVRDYDSILISFIRGVEVWQEVR